MDLEDFLSATKQNFNIIYSIYYLYYIIMTFSLLLIHWNL